MMYSFSRLKHYAECPASFQYKYLYEIPEIPTEPMVLGKAVHSTIQDYLSGAEMELAIERSFENSELLNDRSEVAKLAKHPLVLDIRANAIGGHVENHFTMPLDDDGVIEFQGYIDWWNQNADGSIQLIDWKTNRAKYSPIDTHQMGLYAWYLSQVTGAKEINAELVFLRYPYDTRRQVHTYTGETGAEMQQAREWAILLAEEIEEKLAVWNMLDTDGTDNTDSLKTIDDLFNATPGKHCQHCSYASMCIMSNPVGRGIEINDSADAKKVAAEVVRLEKALDDMKDKLKSWVKVNGSITVGDSAFDFVPSVSWAIGAERLYELCSELHENGIDVFQYLTLTAANLKKLGVGDDKLATYGKKKTTKTFRLVKSKEAC